MNSEQFKTTIDATPAIVWNVLWNDETYPKWAAAFMPGSHAESDWKEGSKILFIGPDRNGMVSKIKEKRKNEYMCFEHLGMVENGKEILNTNDAKDWEGALESYKLKEVNGKTELTAEMAMDEKYKAEFEKAFPKALKIIKTLSEERKD